MKKCHRTSILSKAQIGHTCYDFSFNETVKENGQLDRSNFIKCGFN